MTSKKVVVTGGAGYIGSHTCKQLANRSYEPVVIDNLSRGHSWAVKWGPLHTIDIQDQKAVEEVLRKESPVAVIHFAAFAYVGESMQKPEMYFQNNVSGSLSLLQAMENTGCTNIVFSSTCATYGVPDTIPITEDTEQNPINPYGETKLHIEDHLRSRKNFCSIALRYFNAAGADTELEIGEDHNPETHLIPLAINAALSGSPELSLFGTDYDTPDGTCVRDYVHVEDLAIAHVTAIEKLSPGFQAYNLGTGQGSSVLEVLNTVEKISGRPVPHKVANRRPGDPPTLVADFHKAKKDLSWAPVHDLDSIVSSALGWHEKHFLKNGSK